MKAARLVAGAASDAGRTVVVAALRRGLHRWGVAVEPFKAQNMSPNSAVTIRHGRVARAEGTATGLRLTQDEGCCAGATVGAAWPGRVEENGFRRGFPAWVATHAGRRPIPGGRLFAAICEARPGAPGDRVAEHLDTAARTALVGGRPSPAPPPLTTALGPC